MTNPVILKEEMSGDLKGKIVHLPKLFCLSSQIPVS